MEQLLCHLAGDYVFGQSDWMAMNKSKRSLPCAIHVCLYTACFLLLTVSWKALLVIGITHFILDRWHFITRRLIWYKNHLGPGFTYVPYRLCLASGYFDNLLNEVNNVPRERWETKWGIYNARLNSVSVWLYIITDNFLHLTINFLALKYLS